MAEEEAASKLQPLPAELRVQNNGRVLKVTFDDGCVGAISAERLRQASPDAGEAGPPLPDIAIVDIEQIDGFSVRIGFDDGHDTGVYTWKLLRSLTTH